MIKGAQHTTPPDSLSACEGSGAANADRSNTLHRLNADLRSSAGMWHPADALQRGVSPRSCLEVDTLSVQVLELHPEPLQM